MKPHPHVKAAAQQRGLARARRGGQEPSGHRLTPRAASADRVVKSICPYWALCFGKNGYVQDEKVIQIEGDPDSPISRGRLCPKGSASLQFTTGSARQYQVLYRHPHGTDWEVP